MAIRPRAGSEVNTVFRTRNASAIATGDYTFQNYVAIGTLEDVRTSLMAVMPR